MKGLQDTLISATSYKAIIIRIFGALPVSALVWHLSRNLGVRLYISYVSAFFWLFYSCLTAAIFISYGSGPYGLTSSIGVGSFLLLIFGAFTFSNLRLWASLLIGLLILMVYTVSVALWTEADFVDFIMGDFLTAVALVIGAATKTLFTDRAQRRLFETSELLSKSYTMVEHQVQKRTSELQATNTHLAAEIAERKRAEESQRESEELFRVAMERAPDGVYMNDLEGNFLYGNRKTEELLGYRREELLDRNFLVINIIAEDSLRKATELLKENIERRSTGPDELEFVRKDGRHILIEITTNVIQRGGQTAVLAFIRDITERKRAEQEKAKLEGQLQQAQKMESIGSLAGGIAHDLNNILFPISGLSEMLLDDIPPDTPEHKSIEQIHKSAKRGSDLVKQILAFSRQSNPQKLPILIQPILKEVLKLAQATIPRNIEIKSHINTDCGMVSADPTQVHQIAMNLITNAFHAVEQTGGIIDIALKETEFEKDKSTFHAMPGDLSAGRYACITVSDTGTGIDKALINKIFDPYFTTKELGKGTGLGLSVVHGIVKEHGGDIRVYSEIGKGSVFHVYLPILEDAKDKKDAAVTSKHPTGSESILLVDDEEPIIRMEQMMLEKLGYQTTIRLSSPDALATFKTNPDNFDLVISDRGMPNMTGEQLTMELITIRPNIPVILCTGFSDENDEKRAMDLGVKGFLKKPVARGDLAEMVRKVLDEAKRSSSQ